jgi:transcriptional regulator with XRE-family HTH domain
MENCTEINHKIAQNLAYYRKRAGLTQAELAEKINYSDKSISKWEQGNGIPDVYILLELSKLYQISLNDLVGEPAPEMKRKAQPSKGLKWLIILLSSGIVWLCATCIFVCLHLAYPGGGAWWLAFLYAVLVNAILILVYACIWHYRFVNFLCVSTIIWTAITCLFLTIKSAVDSQLAGLWCIYLIGIPLQVLEILWAFFRTLFRKNKAEMVNQTQEDHKED